MEQKYSITLSELKAVSTRIEPYINKTPVLTSSSLDEIFGCKLYFKCENFQKAGAFKSRGAVNAIFSLPKVQLMSGVATHSSGNHAQALARAAMIRNIKSYIVMPKSSPKVKVKAVEEYGGEITFCDNNLQSREDTLFSILEKTNAIEVHPYNNSLIIAGQATTAKELYEEHKKLDCILAPVGGGGLLSGTALTTRLISPKTTVIGCEPKQADDAYRSFIKRKLIPQTNPKTIADGLRTSLGDINFSIIINNVDYILTASEKSITMAMRMIWERMKIIIEPSSALPIAVLLENKEYFKDKSVGVIISGGNIDLDNFKW
ncbi:MAG: pyridoxal-phosphate dependent enzyme [Hyphomicrobiales bacterium]